MSPNLVSPPPEVRAPDEEAASPPGRRSRRERERGYRRAVVFGLVASLLLHSAVLLVLGPLVGFGRRSATGPPPRTVDREGLEAVRLEEMPPPPQLEDEPAPAPAPRPPPEETEVVRPVPVPEGGEAAEEPAAAEGEVGAEAEEDDRLTNAERLRPRTGDERLWVDFRDPLRLGGERAAAYARADSALRAILRDWLDSLELTAEQRQRAMDWTFRKGDKRWGISSEGLHLGDVTIPIPFGQLFQQGGPKGREARQALRDMLEIQQQDARAEQEEVMEERREEMRRRSREEAERRRSDTTRRNP